MRYVLYVMAEDINDAGESESDDPIPDDLQETLDWATITEASWGVDGEYIAAWDDSHSIQSRNVMMPDDRYTIRYVTWGSGNEHIDSHVELIIGDSAVQNEKNDD